MSDKIIDSAWDQLYSKIADQELVQAIEHIAVTQGSDAVIDYLQVVARRPDVVKLWHFSGLSTAYDYELKNDPYEE